MRKLLLIFVAFGAGLLPIPAFAQNYNFNIGGLQYASGASVPGSCSRAGSYFFKNTSTKGWYICNGATYDAIGTGSGSGTVSSVTFTGDGTVLSSTPSSAVTTSGTVTAALATAAAGTILGNATASTAAPTYTAAPVLGVDNTTAGTLTLANGSAAAHTIWASGATTTNTIKGFAAVPVTGHIVTCTVTSTTCTLTDGGAVGSGTVTSVGFTGGLVSVGTPTSTPAFTVAGTSGGIPFFSSTSTWATSALLTANSPILGGGAGTTPATATFLTTDGVFQLNIGPADTTNNGCLGLKGKTSGTATICAPAAAGTSTNAFLLSNGLQIPTGTAANPAYAFPVFTTSGYGYDTGTNGLYFSTGGLARFEVSAVNFVLRSTLALGFASGDPAANPDVAFSRDASGGGVMDCGNGTAGNKSCTLNLATVGLSAAGSHINTQAASTDVAGTITITSATSAAHTVATAYTNAPNCTLTPTTDPTATGTYWATTSTTAVTANVSTSGTRTFVYHCFAANL